MNKKRQLNSFRILETKTIFKGKVCELSVERLLLPDGKEIEREVVKQVNSVVIVPCLDDNRLLLIRQLRHATGGYIWEFPAGRIDKTEEEPRFCAIRELEEETGYRAREMELLISFFTSPGISTEWMYLFVARDLEKSQTNLEEDEFIQIESFSPSEIYQMIKEGKICDAKTILSYLYWSRLKNEG